MRGIHYTLKCLLTAHGMHSIGRQYEFARFEHARNAVGCLVLGLCQLRALVFGDGFGQSEHAAP